MRLAAAPLLRLPILRPLAEPAMALLWGGLATSSVGDQLFAVVLSWVAIGVLGTAAGYLAALQAGVTLLVALAVGRWVDGRDDRRVMIAADLARAATLVALVAVWLAIGAAPAWALVACVLVLASGQAVFRPALQSVLPTLVDDAALLPAANGLIDTTERIARLLGPGLIGLASAVLPLVHFVTFDATTFLISAASVAAIARRRPAARDAGPGVRHSMLRSVARGFSTVRRDPLLWWQLMTTGVLNGAWYSAYYLGLPLLLARTHPGAAGLAAFGLVIASYGSTNLLSTLVVGGRGLAPRPARMVFGGNLFVGAGIVVIGLAALVVPVAWQLAAFCAGAAVSAVGGPMQDITMATWRQTRLPRGDLAAAVRGYMVMNNGGLLVALLAAPSVLDHTGAGAAVIGCGVVIVGLGLAGLTAFGNRENV